MLGIDFGVKKFILVLYPSKTKEPSVNRLAPGNDASISFRPSTYW
jgi:hypothetical protein